MRSNYDICENLTNSRFYMEVLKSLNNLYNIDQNNTRDNLENQFIFYSKMLKINKRLVYDEELFSAGLWRVCDMFDSNGNLIPFSTWETRGVSGSKFLLWRGLLSKVKTYKINMSYTEVIDGSSVVILPTGDMIDMQNTSSKELYGKTIKLRTVQPTAVSCYLEIFPGLSSKEIESMFIVPRVCTRDNILKEFQFKILHRYLPTNDLLFKMEKVNSRKCTFCNLYRETILHLFYELVNIPVEGIRLLDTVCLLLGKRRRVLFAAVWSQPGVVCSEKVTFEPLTFSKNNPAAKECTLKGNSEVHLHTPTKFGKDPSKDLGGVGEQTNTQTDKRCSNYSMMLLC